MRVWGLLHPGSQVPLDHMPKTHTHRSLLPPVPEPEAVTCPQRACQGRGRLRGHRKFQGAHLCCERQVASPTFVALLAFCGDE